MPRDYKNIKKNTVKKESTFGSLLTFLSGLSIGLFVAVLVFFYGNELANSFDFKRLASKPENKQAQRVTEEEQKNSIKVPELTFEFYEILSNKEVDISALITKALKSKGTPTEEGNYILQVGSFRQHNAADKVKAKLALLGFTASIEPGVINGEDVFRVRIGPYTNLTNLKLARERLLANDLDIFQMRL